MVDKASNSSGIENYCPRIFLITIFLLSSASLSYEINLTRLFSVTQFYHFAFLIVSLALLGFGTSGAFLALFPQIIKKNLSIVLIQISLFAAISFLFAYLVTNHLPFDSFSFALGWKQTGVLFIHMIVLTVPFFFSGLSVVLLISRYAEQTSLIYAINLSGSAFGCLIALLLPAAVTSVGLVIVCTLLAVIACIALSIHNIGIHSSSSPVVLASQVISIVLVIFCLGVLRLIIFEGKTLDFMQLKLSPYKGISYAMQYPGAEIVFQKWNAYSRIDLVQSDGIRSLPGYSYLSKASPPQQDGLFIDGDDLSPVIKEADIKDVSPYMPAAIAYHLRPRARVLILEPHGGLEIAIAHSEGAQSIETSEPNPLILEAAKNIYERDYVKNHLESGRSYLRKSNDRYDVILISLNSSFHPVRSGAYSLGEDYRYTVEAFEEALLRLDDNGLLVLTRWLQTPPSEFLRAFGIAIEAVEKIGGNPTQQIVAFRSYNTGTLMIKRQDFTQSEINTIDEFTSDRAFDDVYFPGIGGEDVNIYNILPDPYYYQAFTSLLYAESREDWYREYAYDVTPPTDDHPFYNQYFKWSQMPQVIAEFGRVWEPFGGAGYVILLLLLLLMVILSFIFILVPTVISIRARTFEKSQLGKLGYFSAIGLAFMFVEIPMIQHFILFLDNPSYSLTIVLFTILLFSGFGSRLSKLFSIKTVFICLLFLSVMNILFLRQAIHSGLGLPLIFRLLLTMILLAPIGFLMGMPFPKGIELLEATRAELVPWAWSVNGTFSVVAGVAAALLAISAGFRWVFIVGTVLYLVAWLLIRVPAIRHQHHRP